MKKITDLLKKLSKIKCLLFAKWHTQIIESLQHTIMSILKMLSMMMSYHFQNVQKVPNQTDGCRAKVSDMNTLVDS